MKDVSFRIFSHLFASDGSFRTLYPPLLRYCYFSPIAHRTKNYLIMFFFIYFFFSENISCGDYC